MLEKLLYISSVSFQKKKSEFSILFQGILDYFGKDIFIEAEEEESNKLIEHDSATLATAFSLTSKYKFMSEYKKTDKLVDDKRLTKGVIESRELEDFYEKISQLYIDSMKK
jgi:hypothetical protein